MPFQCDGCEQKCLYVPALIEGAKFCEACAKDAKKIIASWKSEYEDQTNHTRERMRELFPVPIDPPGLLAVCQMVRNSIYRSGCEDWPTEQLEEVFAILVSRIELWDKRDNESEYLLDVYDALCHQLVDTTVHMISIEIRRRNESPLDAG